MRLIENGTRKCYAKFGSYEKRDPRTHVAQRQNTLAVPIATVTFIIPRRGNRGNIIRIYGRAGIVQRKKVPQSVFGRIFLSKRDLLRGNTAGIRVLNASIK